MGTLAQLAAAALFTMIVWSLAQNLLGLTKMDERMVVTQQELARIRAENQQLVAESDGIASGRLDEAAIRERLGMVKPGETLVLVPDELVTKAEEVVAQMPEKEIEAPKPVWRQWLALFL